MIPVEALPIDLRTSRRGVLWNQETRDGKPTKVPYQPLHPAQRAAVNDPSTWASLLEALAAHADGKSDGIGIVLGDGLVGVDLDSCRNAETGALSAEARAIISELDSYTEVSPSGTGVHILARGELPPGGRRRGKIELYCDGRYFTITGQHVSGTPRGIESRTAELAALHARIFSGGTNEQSRPPRRPAAPALAETDLDDAELLERAASAKNGADFSALWWGDTSQYGGDDSAADLALSNHLAFWTGADGGRMDRLFRQSGLFREKWDERRGNRTYGERTIDTALAGCRDTFSGGRSGSRRTNTDGAEVPSLRPPVQCVETVLGTQNDGPGVGEPPVRAAGAPIGPVALGQIDPETARLVISPRRTLPTAEAYVRTFHDHPDHRTLVGYVGQLLEWRDNRYVELEEETLRHRLHPWLHAALRPVIDRRTGAPSLTDFEANPTTVNAALETIRAYVHLSSTISAPAWLIDRSGDPPAGELLACRGANLHIPSRRILPSTPALFTTNALDFDYDPSAPAPTRFLAFLEEQWGDDRESVDLVQEWFGYALTPDTRQQKILLVVGPRRSGKGTLARVLARLVGETNVVGPTASSFAGAFGLQPLIGKSLAIVSDARFGGEHVSTVIERLLSISGEDVVSIDRKFQGSISLKLPTRFVIVSNELPRLSDTSTALAGRFLVLRLTRSFYGQEDPTLTGALLAELPGILRWALDGWERLHDRGRFVQPASAADAIQQIEDLSAPVAAFVRTDCVVGPGFRTPTALLYAAWKRWCERDGRTAATTDTTFGRDLLAAVPGVRRRRGTNDVRFYEGIGLRETGE